MSGAEEIGKAGDRHIEADLVARDEVARWHKEVADLAFHIEEYMVANDLTLGHFDGVVEAFNKRNHIVMPEMKISAVKKLFEKITEQHE